MSERTIYKIVEAKTAKEIEQKVQSHSDAGWHLLGGVSAFRSGRSEIYPDIYVQAMIGFDDGKGGVVKYDD